MRIAVFGSNGLFGSTLVPHLRSHGHAVLCPTRAGPQSPCGDLTDEIQVRSILDELWPDVIINLAALTSVDKCERDPKAAYLANVRIVENLARWMRQGNNPCHLIQISTDQVYDGPGPHRENDIRLTNYYGFSKYAGELAAAQVSSTVLRTNFFGLSRCPGKMSWSDWLVQALSRGDAITVFDDVRFSPLSLESLAQLVELAALRRHPGVFNLGSNEGMTKGDFAFALADAMDLAAGSIRRDTCDSAGLFAYRPKDMRMDCGHFEATFQIELPTLREEIQAMKGYYQNEVRTPPRHCRQEDRL